MFLVHYSQYPYHGCTRARARCLRSHCSSHRAHSRPRSDCPAARAHSESSGFRLSCELDRVIMASSNADQTSLSMVYHENTVTITFDFALTQHEPYTIEPSRLANTSEPIVVILNGEWGISDYELKCNRWGAGPGDCDSEDEPTPMHGLARTYAYCARSRSASTSRQTRGSSEARHTPVDSPVRLHVKPAVPDKGMEPVGLSLEDCGSSEARHTPVDSPIGISPAPGVSTWAYQPRQYSIRSRSASLTNATPRVVDPLTVATWRRTRTQSSRSASPGNSIPRQPSPRTPSVQSGLSYASAHSLAHARSRSRSCSPRPPPPDALRTLTRCDRPPLFTYPQGLRAASRCAVRSMSQILSKTRIHSPCSRRLLQPPWASKIRQNSAVSSPMRWPSKPLVWESRCRTSRGSTLVYRRMLAYHRRKRGARSC
ncbi:hypothetical protein B0H21DRAFT_741495, partial [Amylocystis lapponica]